MNEGEYENVKVRTNCLNFKDAVVTGGVVGERGHPAELLPQHVQHLRCVEHLLFKVPQEIFIFLCELLSQSQSLF